MLKKLLGGLVFGAGFAIAAIIVFSVWMSWILPKQLGAMGPRISGATESVTTAPPAVEGRYLGALGSYRGGFSHESHTTLAAGEGRITGVVTDGDRPVSGLRVRLALNGSVMSQWGESDHTGRYEIALPVGEYRLDGYEIDREAADRVLANRIDSPIHQYLGAMVTVAKGRPAEGFAFRFVRPVEKLGPRGALSARNNVIANWKPYPGAHSYSVQVWEGDGAFEPRRTQLFAWEKRPRVEEPSLNLTREQAGLKPGRYYFIEVTAEDAAGDPISKTAGTFEAFDFRLVE